MKKSLLTVSLLLISAIMFGASYSFYEVPTASWGSVQYTAQGYTVNFGTYTYTALYVSPAQNTHNIGISGVITKTLTQYSIAVSIGNYQKQLFLRRLYENW